MFGYVMPLKEELKIKEYDIFRSYYCSLCCDIGKKSYISKMTLTYDMTFLAILLSSIFKDTEEAYKAFCPFKMKKVLKINTNEYIDYAADMNIILSNRKLIDNYLDDKNYFYLILSKIINTRKLSELAKHKINSIDNELSNIAQLEKDKCSNIDEIGNCFGRLTAEIFTVDEGSIGKILNVLGFNIGKWIYTIDAFDDLIDDINKKRYNPFIYAFSYNEKQTIDFKKSISENVEFTLIRCLDEISKAFELLEIKKNKSIIDNVIYLGIYDRTSKAIRGGCNNEKSIRDLRG